MSSVTAEFEWDRSEFLHVQRFAAIPWINRLPVFGLIVIFAGVEEIYLGSWRDARLLFVVGVLLFVYQGWLLWLIPRVWNRRFSAHPKIKVVTSESGVTSVSGDDEKRAKREEYRRSKEWSSYYFLKRNRLIVRLIVPKRGFVSPQDVSTFRTLLRSHTASTLARGASPELGAPN